MPFIPERAEASAIDRAAGGGVSAIPEAKPEGGAAKADQDKDSEETPAP